MPPPMTPPAQPMGQMPQPGAEEAGEMGEGAEGAEDGYTICIHVGADKSLSVGMEGGEMQPASTEKEALTIALNMIRGEESNPAEMQGEFQAGFKG